MPQGELSPSVKRWGLLVTLGVLTFLLPSLFPDSRPLNVLFRGTGFFITWGILLGVWGLWNLVRRYVRARYPESPPVPVAAYGPLALCIVLFLVMVFVDEYYRVNPIPDSPLLRLYLFFFGYRRYLFAFPFVGFFVFFLWSRFFHRRKEETKKP